MGTLKRWSSIWCGGASGRSTAPKKMAHSERHIAELQRLVYLNALGLHSVFGRRRSRHVVGDSSERCGLRPTRVVQNLKAIIPEALRCRKARTTAYVPPPQTQSVEKSILDQKQARPRIQRTENACIQLLDFKSGCRCSSASRKA